MQQTDRWTDKLLHWGTADLYWLGEDHFQLEVKTAIEADAVNWLNVHLAGRLAARLGADIGVEAKPALRAANGSGFGQFGTLAISGFAVPFLDADELRELIFEAVADAHEAAAVAIAQADAYLKQLRAG